METKLGISAIKWNLQQSELQQDEGTSYDNALLSATALF